MLHLYIIILNATVRQTDLCQRYLLSSTWLPLQDSLRRLIVLVRHGTGEGGHSLTIANVETDVWMGYEELYDDVVLAANGSMDGSSALCILTEMNRHRMKHLEKEHEVAKKNTQKNNDMM